jgi:hypothetical protein
MQIVKYRRISSGEGAEGNLSMSETTTAATAAGEA